MAIKTETVPQLYNLALATSVIVTVGDAVQDLIEKIESSGADRLSQGEAAVLAALLAYVLLWSTKIFVDDNQVLLAGKSRGWHGLDLLYLVVSYSFLISAAAALTSDYFLGFLAGHFVTLIIWVLSGYLCASLEKRGILRGRCPPDDKKGPDYRPVWLIIDLLSLGAIGLMMSLDDRSSWCWWWAATAALYLFMGVKLIGAGDGTADEQPASSENTA
jgi:hypothetical protein